MLAINNELKFLGLGTGMIVFYSVWAVYQEKLFRGRYGSDVQTNGDVGEKFTFSIVFVAVQNIVSAVFAKGNRVEPPYMVDKLRNCFFSCDLNHEGTK